MALVVRPCNGDSLSFYGRDATDYVQPSFIEHIYGCPFLSASLLSLMFYI